MAPFPRLLKQPGKMLNPDSLPRKSWNCGKKGFHSVKWPCCFVPAFIHSI